MLNKENLADLNIILDCFTGADGGVSFFRFKTLLERMQDENSETAEQVLDIMRTFSRLIDAANRK